MLKLGSNTQTQNSSLELSKSIPAHSSLSLQRQLFLRT
jgi:hypothetical protein